MKFVLQRLAFYLLTAWAAITINFLIPRLMPGDPVQSLLARYQGQLSSKSIASLEALFGLDRDSSLWQQYTDYWAGLARSDLGTSFTFFPTPVSEVIAQSLPWTLALVGTTTLISFLLGTGIGIFAGWKRGSWLDGLLPVTTFISAIPYFWLGLIAIAVFAVQWPLFPPPAATTPPWCPLSAGSSSPARCTTRCCRARPSCSARWPAGSWGCGT